MGRPAFRLALRGLAVPLALGLAACGTQKLETSDPSPAVNRGAVLFSQRCSGCHTIEGAAGAHGSASNIRIRERNDGPNFRARKENVQRVLYAISNGGFSGAIMPQNIVVGPDAQAVAQFVEKYSGPGSRQTSPTQGKPSGASGGSTP
jgi:mono/diheme cytochrome c family protein